MITNELEQVNMVMNSTDLLSRKTALSHHPFVDDAEEEIKEIEEDESKLEEDAVEEGMKDEDIEETEDIEQEGEEEERPTRDSDSKKDNKKVQK